MKNNAYYIGRSGNEIMNSNNFGNGIIRYLNYEQAFVSRVLSKNHYSTLIEFGCDEIRLYGNCAINNVKYIGVDIRSDLKDFADHYFSENNHVEGHFINTCLSKFDEFFENDVNNSVLCVFPFNLIGNLDDVERQIAKCYELGFELIVSQFNTTHYAKAVRYGYYQKCGFYNLSFKEDKSGHLFVGADFESKSYHYEYLLNCIVNIGFEKSDEFLDNSIQIFHFTRRRV